MDVNTHIVQHPKAKVRSISTHLISKEQENMMVATYQQLQVGDVVHSENSGQFVCAVFCRYSPSCIDQDRIKPVSSVCNFNLDVDV